MRKSLFNTLDDFCYRDKTVILRVDINSPLDPVTKTIVNDNRLDKSIPTLKELLEQGAKIVLLAHQGDTLDYHNLIPLTEHAQKLSKKVGQHIDYIDDAAGPAAEAAVQALKPGEAVLLGNVRYLTEEVSTFEDSVSLSVSEMAECYLIRRLAPLADYYVNDAFSAAHRNAPSMVGFTAVLPTAAGRQLVKEVSALEKIMKTPASPAVFVLGGLKIADAFGMIEGVLKNGSADSILTGGVLGIVMLMAGGTEFSREQTRFVYERGLGTFLKPAERYLRDYGDRFVNPKDFAFRDGPMRREVDSKDLLKACGLLMDIGEKTIQVYRRMLNEAGSIFINGPMGVYEDPLFSQGTKEVWKAAADSSGYSVVGGGDSVNAAVSLVDDAENRFSYICTAGGALVRYLSGMELPLIKALKEAYRKV
ncbi:MAG: phosphoglycerate kinase [Firmicutes bacterium]|nr:phosphoglycerate kinase [Bacillota bacterium]